MKQAVEDSIIGGDSEWHQAIELLEAVGKTAAPYEHPILLLNFMLTYYDDDREFSDGCRGKASFFKGLTRFFLNPKNAAAYKESGGGSSLETELPLLLEYFTDLSNSVQAAAIVERQLYISDRVSLTRERHNKVMQYYGSKMEGYKAENKAWQQPSVREVTD